MGNREKEVLWRVFSAILPTAWAVVVKVVEDIVKRDLDGDGVVGGRGADRKGGE